jgi:fructose-bisphosphate aldolase, class II
MRLAGRHLTCPTVNHSADHLLSRVPPRYARVVVGSTDFAESAASVENRAPPHGGGESGGVVSSASDDDGGGFRARCASSCKEGARSWYEASVTLARLTDVLAPASASDTGLGAFNVFSIEHAEAFTAAAEAAKRPVILQISQNAVRYHGALAPIGLATLTLARGAGVPIVVHLDHATDKSLVEEAIALGFGSVMFDASTMPYAENVVATAAIVRQGHDGGLDVEAELGEVGGKDGVHAAGARTRPEEAQAFVEATGVDALAVAVGTSHAMTERHVALDLALISALRAAVPVPLVLHGSSGVPDAELVRAVEAGMTKINIATHLNQIFTGSIRATLAGNPGMVDSRRYLGPARDAITAEAERLLRLLDRSSG